MSRFQQEKNHSWPIKTNGLVSYILNRFLVLQNSTSVGNLLSAVENGSAVNDDELSKSGT